MNLLRQYLAISFLCLSSQAFCMEKEAALSYFQTVKQIDATGEKGVKNFLNHIDLADASSGKEIVEKQLQAIEQTLINLREQIFVLYKKEHGVSDERWNRCTREIQLFERYMQENSNNLQFPHIVHDKRIPAGFMTKLKNSLMRNGINPNTVNLMPTEQCDFNALFFDYGHRAEDYSVIEIIPASISVDVSFIQQLSKDAQEGLCALLAYSIKGECILSGSSSTDKTWQTLLRQYTYVSSLFALALKNDNNNAQLLKTLCRELYNSFFAIEDYQLLSDICGLHEILAGLKSMEYKARLSRPDRNVVINFYSI